MFNIKALEYLSSQIGEGLKIGNSTFCCARITEVELPEGTTLKEIVEADGVVLGYHMEKPDENGKPVVVYNTENLSDANNYVLVIKHDDGTEEIVNDAIQITRLFNLPDEDAEKLMEHIGKLAESRNLLMGITEDLHGDRIIFFNNTFDVEMVDYFLEDNQELAFRQLAGLVRSPEYFSELQNHNFIKMFLVGLIKTSQDRYNKLYRDDVIYELAQRLCEINYWEDGKLLKPSIKDIENFFDEMKNQIVVR